MGRKTGDARTFIGPSTNPIWWGTRKEKRDIASNPDVPWLYEVWRNLHLWGQWPDGRPWNKQDAEVVDIVNSVEMMYRSHFATDTVIMQKTAETAAYTHVMAQGKKIK